MIVEQAERDVAVGGVHGTDLGEDVDAVLVLVHHAVDSPDLSLDALETGLVALLVLDVAVLVAASAAPAGFGFRGGDRGIGDGGGRIHEWLLCVPWSVAGPGIRDLRHLVVRVVVG